MAQSKKPWEMTPAELAAAGGPVSPRPFIIPGAPADPSKEPLTAAQLRVEQARAAQAAAQAAADTRIKNAQATKLERDNRIAAEGDSLTDPKVTSNKHGQAYLDAAGIPPDQQALIKSIAMGNLPAGQRSIASKTMIPILQHVVNFDPSFSTTTFQQRSDFFKNAISGKDGLSIDAAGTAMGHAYALRNVLGDLNNHNGVAGTLDWLGNAFNSNIRRTPAVGTAESELSKFSKENAAAYGESTGAERGASLNEIPINASPEQMYGTLKGDVNFFSSKLAQFETKARRVLGPSFDINNYLSPEAQQARDYYRNLNVNGIRADGTHPGEAPLPSAFVGADTAGGGGYGGGGTRGPNVSPIPGGPAMVLATGGSKAIDTSKVNAIINGMIRSGASDAQISAAIQPLGYDAVNPRQTAAARAYLAKNPNYAGSFGGVHTSAPTTTWERVKNNPIAQSVATGVLGAGDAAMLGTSDEVFGAGKSLFTGRPIGEEIADLNGAKQAAFANNPMSALTGQTLGTIGSMWAGGGRLAAGAAKLGIPKLIAPIVADVAIGGAGGAGQDNDNRGLGALVGGLGALGGNLGGMGVGKLVGAAARTAPGLAVTNGARRIGGMFGGRGFGPVTAAAPVSSAEKSILSTIGPQLPDVTAQLGEAQNLNVPMSLADTIPGLRELTGAAVRKSPTAAGVAEQNLLPRNLGQYDRFTSAVDQNFGPTANIPQRSADLTAQARTAAGPLYGKAYAAPVITTPELDATLNTPFGQQALARARTIAANERRDPSELGFGQDAQGNVILNRQPYQAMSDHLAARNELDAAQAAYRVARETPGASTAGPLKRITKARQGLRDAEAAMTAAPDPSQAANVPGLTTQTLDYIKRGMDDVLEDQRNPITGKLVLDEAGRAQDQVRKQFLAEVDRINPAYADARAAYAGPASERSNMAAGQDAYTANPQQLGVDIAGASPERLGQLQLGYQGALVDHAGRVRDSANPWEATLGSPMARDRFTTMFPDSPGLANFFRQRELESGMQQTSNAILGNSRTARNLAADQAFADNPIADAAVHGGLAVATHGATLPVTAMRMAGTGLGDWWKFGRGASAVAKADALVPTLTKPDPGAALSTLNDLLGRQQAYKDFVTRTTPTRPLGMFGSGLGSQLGLAPLTYAGG